MLATFQVRNSTIDLNGVDISGLNNTVEVTITAKTDKQPTGRLVGKADVSIKQKMFLREEDLDQFIDMCSNSPRATYRFTRECLQYTVPDVNLFISKEDPIAGVIPVELHIGAETLPIKTRISK